MSSDIQEALKEMVSRSDRVVGGNDYRTPADDKFFVFFNGLRNIYIPGSCKDAVIRNLEKYDMGMALSLDVYRAREAEDLATLISMRGCQ